MAHPEPLGIVFGGRSAEHAVSLRSAASVLDALDRERFVPRLIGIAPDGRFLCGVEDQPPEVVVEAGAPIGNLGAALRACRAVFPVVHGPYGEDGSLQGLLECYGVPYVGSGVFASALCMNKGHFKRWLKAHGLPVAPYVNLVVNGSAAAALDKTDLSDLRAPLFVKPASLGSSVGITRVTERNALEAAVEQAARHDAHVVLEQGLDARELEVAVLDAPGREPLVSDVGEIVLPKGCWYDYETKYESDVAQLSLPARLDDETRARARALALETFRVVGARGLSRVDFFLDRKRHELFINEVNTLPGFTSISMYPKLIAHAGIPYSELITRLVERALHPAPG